MNSHIFRTTDSTTYSTASAQIELKKKFFTQNIKCKYKLCHILSLSVAPHEMPSYTPWGSRHPRLGPLFCSVKALMYAGNVWRPLALSLWLLALASSCREPIYDAHTANAITTQGECLPFCCEVPHTKPSSSDPRSDYPIGVTKLEGAPLRST